MAPPGAAPLPGMERAAKRGKRGKKEGKQRKEGEQEEEEEEGAALYKFLNFMAALQQRNVHSIC